MPIFAGTRQVLLGFRPKTHIWTPAATTPTYNAELLVNAGATGQTDWDDGNADGLADSWVKGTTTTDPPTCTIVTGNGFAGNAQRVVKVGATGSEYIAQNSGQSAGNWYRITFKYRSNFSFRFEYTQPGGYIGNYAANTGDAISGSGCGRRVGATSNNNFMNEGAVGNWCEIDEISSKQINFASCLAGARDVGYKNGRFSRAVSPALHWVEGVVANLDNPLNPQNYVYATVTRYATATASLVKVIAGTTTVLIAGTITYVAGASPEIRVSGTTYQLFYNGTQVGTNQTITELTGTWGAGFDPAGTATGQMQAVPQ